MGKFQLSQASSSPSSSSSSVLKFKLPSLKVESKSNDLTNLFELANIQLKNYQQTTSTETSKFSIPNIFSTKQLKVNPVIDLKSALLSDSEEKKLPKEPEFKCDKREENFIPKFIDCDLTSSFNNEMILSDNAVILTSTLKDLIDESVLVNEPTMMGKIIGKRYRKRVPYIQHSYKPLKEIARFKFDSPSPDDQILAHLQRK